MFWFRDQTVERNLKKAGFTGDLIYYSPVRLWLFWVFVFQLLFLGLFPFVGWWCLIFAAYAFICYLLIRRGNFSFAIENDFLFVADHTGVIKYQRTEIDSIRIKSDKGIEHVIRLIPESKELILYLKNGERKIFPCHFIERDAFDEQMTKNTIENLANALKNWMGREIVVEGVDDLFVS